MARLRIVLNNQILYPLLPIDATDEAVGEEQRMANGVLRRWHRRDVRVVTLRGADLSESERDQWIAASPLTQSVIYTDETESSRPMLVRRRTISLSRTQPVLPNGANTTGPAFYAIELELEAL